MIGKLLRWWRARADAAGGPKGSAAGAVTPSSLREPSQSGAPEAETSNPAAASSPSDADAPPEPAGIGHDDPASDHPESDESAPPVPADAVRAAIDGLRERLEEVRSDTTDLRDLLDLLRDAPGPELRQIPAAAHAIMRATRDLDAPRSKLVGLIEGDPAIAQALLKTANSVIFNPGGSKITSLGHGLDRLGMTSTRAVVLHRTLNGLICRPGGEMDAMAPMVWTHMAETAALARALSRSFGADPDEAFATALLHDVGKLVIFDACSDLRQRRRRPIHLRPDLLSEILRELHEPLGAFAAGHWGLPDGMVHAVATHHRRDSEAPSDPLAETVHLAERIDIARRSRREVELDRWWEEGRLHGDREAVEAMLGPADADAA